MKQLTYKDVGKIKVGDKLRFREGICSRYCRCQDKSDEDCPLLRGAAFTVVEPGSNLFIDGPKVNCCYWNFDASFPIDCFERAYSWRKI